MERLKRRRHLETARKLGEIIGSYYQAGIEAKKAGRPIGWIPPMNGAIELFYAMDIHPVFPENWSPICAATSLASKNFQISEKIGYSRDLCGYLRNIVGYIHEGMRQENQPFGGLPEPDFLLDIRGGCNPVKKTFQALRERFRVPTFLCDLPPVPPEGIEEHHVKFCLREMEKLVAFLEGITGKPLDMGRLKEVVHLSDQACRLWDEIMNYRAVIPTPFSVSDIGIMFVMVTCQGTEVAVSFLEEVRKEVVTKVEAGLGTVPEEKLRLYWDNIPLWYNLALFNKYEKMGVVFVAETYSTAWSIRLDPEQPLESLAKKSLLSYPLCSCVSVDQRVRRALNFCRQYHIDGAVLHSNKSCKPITLGQMDIKRALEQELGIPCLVVEADHMDRNNFSEAQFYGALESFIELLLMRKYG